MFRLLQGAEWTGRSSLRPGDESSQEANATVWVGDDGCLDSGVVADSRATEKVALRGIVIYRKMRGVRSPG